jgi:hypothetical protein
LPRSLMAKKATHAIMINKNHRKRFDVVNLIVEL